MADYIIVGAGVFGTSTAWHLATSEPNAKIILIDRCPFPDPSAASSDLNKIVRADYADIFYMRLALEALDEWNTNPQLQPYFHETGMLFAEDIGMGTASVHNYRRLGVDPGAEILSQEQALAKFPVFNKANWTGVQEHYWNPRSGWGETDPALRAVMQATLVAGVTYIQKAVDKLVFDDKGACVGVKTSDGSDFQAKAILLCTGAWTARLLADSLPDNNLFQVNGRMVAAAATSCIVRCNPEYLSLYRDAPVHFLGLSHTHG